jgi:hypothetical protein
MSRLELTSRSRDDHGSAASIVSWWHCPGKKKSVWEENAIRSLLDVPRNYSAHQKPYYKLAKQLIRVQIIPRTTERALQSPIDRLVRLGGSGTANLVCHLCSVLPYRSLLAFFFVRITILAVCKPLNSAKYNSEKGRLAFPIELPKTQTSKRSTI